MHRPRDDFYLNVSPLTLSDAAISIEAQNIRNPRPGDESHDWWEDEIEEGFMTLAEGRERAWNHFSSSFGVPRCPERLISAIGARDARESVAKRGGILAVAQHVLNAGDYADWADQFFLPWPFASIAQRARIAEFFLERQRYAQGLWDSAMDTATGR